MGQRLLPAPHAVLVSISSKVPRAGTPARNSRCSARLRDRVHAVMQALVHVTVLV